jgi:hypothetical protein
MREIEACIAAVLAIIMAAIVAVGIGLMWLLTLLISVGLPTVIVLWILDYVKLINIW